VLPCAYAELAYEPDVTALWSAVLAAEKAPFAYDDPELATPNAPLAYDSADIEAM